MTPSGSLAFRFYFCYDLWLNQSIKEEVFMSSICGEADIREPGYHEPTEEKPSEEIECLFTFMLEY